MDRIVMLKSFIKRLEIKLAEQLPGQRAQQLMMPAENTRARFDLSKDDVKRGSVLILFYEQDNNILFPLTQRHDYGGVHGGQVSLPGGKVEDEDETLEDTALRETYEEIGIDKSEVNVIGRLSDLYIPPSNFRVTPIIGYMESAPVFELDPFEVKELIATPLHRIVDKAHRKRKDITVRKGIRLNAPYFDVHGKVVWGATAMILSELVSILDE